MKGGIRKVYVVAVLGVGGGRGKEEMIYTSVQRRTYDNIKDPNTRAFDMHAINVILKL